MIELLEGYGHFVLLPNTLFKSIILIFDCCTIILHLLGKREQKKTIDQSIVSLLTGHVTNDVTKRQMSGKSTTSIDVLLTVFR